MKRIIYSICIITLLIGSNSCSSDPIDENNSIFELDKDIPKNAFDVWIYNNYTKKYNIDFKYRMEYKESDMEYNLIPADFNKSVILAQIIQKMWLEAYDEEVGPDFLKLYVPRVLHFVGSGAYDGDGSVVLGTAEGGKKVTLYNVNELPDPLNMEVLSDRYFHVMHHEFAHILHQTKNYSEQFEQISKSDYITDNWKDFSDSDALRLGFISAYSRKEVNEDFVEIYSYYITYPESWWNNKLAQAGKTGEEKLKMKLAIVKEYFNTEWNIDLDNFRGILARRGQEVLNMDFLTFEQENIAQ